MTSVLKIRLEDLNSQMIKELQREFGKKAALELRVNDFNEAENIFSTSDFWVIIDCLDWTKGTIEDVLKPAIHQLASLSAVCNFLFSDLLSEKLFSLDTKSHAQLFIEADGFLSVDDFLYSRCAVIAEGESYYQKVLADPTLMPKNLIFEALLSLAPKAYYQKTGKELSYIGSSKIETYSNQNAWK